MPSSQRSRDFLCLRASRHRNMFFCFPIYLPIIKAYSTKQPHYCSLLSCNPLLQLIDNSATKGLFVDRQLSYSCLSHSSSVPAANDCRVVLTFQIKSFLSWTFSFFLIGKPKPCPTRQWVLVCPPTCVPHERLQPELVRQSNSCVGWCVYAKKNPLKNVPGRSPLFFSIFLHQISCTRVQSIF